MMFNILFLFLFLLQGLLATHCPIRKDYAFHQEHTLGLLKPSFANEKNLELVKQFIREKEADYGLQILNIKKLKLEENTVNKFYEEHKERTFFNELKEMMISDDMFAFVIRGCNAIKLWRQIIGSTDPEVDRKKGVKSLRALIGINKTFNGLHGSDSVNNAWREINIIYNKK